MSGLIYKKNDICWRFVTISYLSLGVINFKKWDFFHPWQHIFWSVEVGIEKKIASVSPNNSDVQYQFLLQQHVLGRLCSDDSGAYTNEGKTW
jgi:hypothetical protein